MTDPFSIAVGAASLIGQAIQLSDTIYKYINCARKAPQTVEKLQNELSRLRHLLEGLEEVLQDPKANTNFRNTEEIYSARADCELRLAGLERKLSSNLKQSAFMRLCKALEWPFREEDIQKILESIYRYTGAITAANGIDQLKMSDKILNRQAVEHHRQVLRWLTRLDLSVYHAEAQKQHIEGTGEWIFETADFKKWINSPGSLFTIFGTSGCGKTVTCSSSIDYLRKYNDDAIVLYFFFDVNQQTTEDRRVQTLVRWLIKQLSAQALSMDVETLYGMRYDLAHESDYVDTLQKLLCGFNKVFLVIDGADECTEQPKLMELIQQLRHRHSNNLRIFLSSGQLIDVHDLPRDTARFYVQLEPSLLRDDIAQCIDDRISRSTYLNKLCKDLETRTNVRTTLINGANGMFRWVTLYLDSLERCTSLPDLNQKLRNPPSDIWVIYDRILEDIHEENRAVATKLLQWLFFTPSPLSLREIECALSVSIIDDLENLDCNISVDVSLNIQHVLDLCQGLIRVVDRPKIFSTKDPSATLGRSEPRDFYPTAGNAPEPRMMVDQKDQIVAFAHPSVRKYLESKETKFGMGTTEFCTKSNLIMAETCVAFLLRVLPRELVLSTMPKERDFLLHATDFWRYYAKLAQRDCDWNTLEKLCDELLNPRKDIYLKWLHLYHYDKLWDSCDESYRFSKTSDKFPDPICHLVEAGLTSLVQKHLDRGTNPNTLGSCGETLLSIATRRGSVDIVNILITRGASVKGRGDKNVKNYDPWETPIIAAAASGHAAIVRRLIDADCDTTSHIEGRVYLGRALRGATWEGHTECVEILLQNNASIHIKSFGCGNPVLVHDVFYKKHHHLMSLFLKYCKNIIDDIEIWYGLLEVAIGSNAPLDIIEMLIAGQVDGRDPDPRVGEKLAKALCTAAKNGNLKTIDLLHKHLPNDEKYGSSYSLALKSAFENGKFTAAKSLLAIGANPRLWPEEHRKILKIVAEAGDLCLMKEWLKTINNDLRDADLLISAAISTNLELLSFLVKQDNGFCEQDYSTALRAVAGISRRYTFPGFEADVPDSRLEVVRLLIDCGAKVNSRAVDHVVEEIDWNVEFEVNARNPTIERAKESTPLTLAAGGGNLAIMQILMAEGADVNAIRTQDSALNCAIKDGCKEMVLYLLENDADTRLCLLTAASSKRCWESLGLLLLEHKCAVNESDEQGCTALHLMSFWGNLEAVKGLIHYGADTNARTLDQRSPLHNAASGGTSIMKTLLENDADVNASDSRGLTALHIAASWGITTNLQKLLSNGAHVDARTRKNETALSIALKRGHSDLANILLQAGANPNLQDFAVGRNALQHAVAGCFLDTAHEILGSQGSDIIVSRDDNGDTALHLAVHNAHESMIYMLLNKGANPSLKNNHDETPLHLIACSIWRRDKNIMPPVSISVTRHWPQDPALYDKFLEWTRSDQSRGVHIASSLLIYDPSLVEEKDRSGATPLLRLAKDSSEHDLGYEDETSNPALKDIGMMRLLLRAGASPNRRDNDGKTALHFAADSGSETLVRWLIDLDNFTEIDSVDCHGRSALSYACERGHHAIIGLLLARMNNVDSEDEDGVRSLDHALALHDGVTMRLLFEHGSPCGPPVLFRLLNSGCRKCEMQRRFECLQAAIEHGANPRTISRSGQTLLHLAASNNHILAADYFIEKCGLEIEARGKQGRTPLHAAAISATADMVQHLLAAGARLDERDSNGQTPLHLAARKGNARIVRVLVENGAYLDMRDWEAKTPLDLALHNKREATRRLLDEFKAARLGEDGYSIHTSIYATREWVKWRWGRLMRTVYLLGNSCLEVLDAAAK